jgi:NAD(P)-dependent dehydrogenase (short-subunit alcohol dehydrogenase family)
MKKFSGKVALITGGSSGLGEATALKFAQEGAKVVIAARRAEQSAEVVKRIVALGGEAHFVRADMSRAADIEAMVKEAVARFGKLDCAVNNAGISGPRLVPLADVSESQWDEVMNVNLKAVWLCMKHQIPAMLANGGGSIVNISSIYGSKPSDMGHGPYATSKHGVIGLSTSAAVDYGQTGIRINVVAPGFTRSEMVNPDRAPRAAEHYKLLTARHSSMNRLGKAEEVANAIAWLCSEEASFVNGAVFTVDGGGAGRLG